MFPLSLSITASMICVEVNGSVLILRCVVYNNLISVQTKEHFHFEHDPSHVMCFTWFRGIKTAAFQGKSVKPFNIAFICKLGFTHPDIALMKTIPCLVVLQGTVDVCVRLASQRLFKSHSNNSLQGTKK